MAIIGGDQGKAGESKGSGRKADDLRLSCLCLLLMNGSRVANNGPSVASYSKNLDLDSYKAQSE